MERTSQSKGRLHTQNAIGIYSCRKLSTLAWRPRGVKALVIYGHSKAPRAASDSSLGLHDSSPYPNCETRALVPHSADSPAGFLVLGRGLHSTQIDVRDTL
jgi:hypothetical protein